MGHSRFGPPKLLTYDNDLLRLVLSAAIGAKRGCGGLPVITTGGSARSDIDAYQAVLLTCKIWAAQVSSWKIHCVIEDSAAASLGQNDQQLARLARLGARLGSWECRFKWTSRSSLHYVMNRLSPKLMAKLSGIFCPDFPLALHWIEEWAPQLPALQSLHCFLSTNEGWPVKISLPPNLIDFEWSTDLYVSGELQRHLQRLSTAVGYKSINVWPDGTGVGIFVHLEHLLAVPGLRRAAVFGLWGSAVVTVLHTAPSLTALQRLLAASQLLFFAAVGHVVFEGPGGERYHPSQLAKLCRQHGDGGFQVENGGALDGASGHQVCILVRQQWCVEGQVKSQVLAVAGQ